MSKTCGSCNLCCKIVAVESLKKPAGRWCTHASPGKGCTIYGQHPDDCRGFRCGWLEDESMPDNWKPTVARFVMRAEIDGRRLCIDVDPSSPFAWRQEPYYSAIKQMSESAWHDIGHVVVYVGKRGIAVFPEEDIELGLFATGEELMAGYRYDKQGQWRQPFARIRDATGAVRTFDGQRYRGGRRG